jgi:hypothetical protein
VTWYTTDDSLIQIVDDNHGVSVLRAPLSDQPAVGPEGRADFAVQIAAAILDSGLQPHPVPGVRVIPIAEESLTYGSWTPCTLQVERVRGTLCSIATPTSETAWHLYFHTDGRFVRFDIAKGYPGSAVWGDPNAARFEPTSTPPAPHPTYVVPPPPAGTEPIHISNSISDEDLAHEVSPEGLKDE